MRMVGLRDRTKKFALRIIRLSVSLPKTMESQVIWRQLLRSGTSVAANFREASRARSEAEFVAKLGIVEQELDESLLWMELLVESDIISIARMQDLMTEADELIRITVKAIQSTKKSQS